MPGICKLASFIVYVFGYIRKIQIGFFFLVQCPSKDIMDFIFAENICKFAKGTVGGDFVVFDLLCSNDQSRITNRPPLEFRNRLPAFRNKAFHRGTFFRVSLRNAKTFKDLLEAGYVFFGLFKMERNSLFKVFVIDRLRNFS